MSIITTFENQCRALTSTISPDEDASRFIVGTLSTSGNNLLYIFEYKEDNNNLAKVSFRFPYGEVWHLSTSNKYPNLAAAVLGNKGKFSVGVLKLPDELNNSIEDDYGLSESSIDKLFEPISESKNLVRLSQWHPDDGYQLLTCDNGNMTIWDIDKESEVRKFSLTEAAERNLDLEPGSMKPLQISNFRWSSLFDCSVVAAAIGSKIYGVDTRIPDSSPSSICWLIEDQRCNRIRSIDFNPNSQYYIASGGDDCRANFWDLRQSAKPVLRLQTHSHWIWSIRYNPFHDQLVLSAGSDARVVLMRAQSVASDPYGHLAGDDEGDLTGSLDDGGADENEEVDDYGQTGMKSEIIADDKTLGLDSGQSQRRDKKQSDDEVISVYEEHDDSVYAVEWATDPWIFASLGFESRLVISRVPKAEKFSILF